MTHEPPPYWQQAADTQPVPPPKKQSRHPIGLYIGIAVIVALCGIGGVITAAVIGAADDKPKGAPVAGVPDRGAVPTPNVKPAPATPTTPARSTLSKSDVELTVKITEKNCFGSAGCNVQWDLKAAVEGGKANRLVAAGDTCSVTYRMRGLTDTQTGTLTINDDGTYNSDSWNFGQTKKSSAKVTAEVTEVECGR